MAQMKTTDIQQNQAQPLSLARQKKYCSGTDNTYVPFGQGQLCSNFKAGKDQVRDTADAQ